MALKNKFSIATYFNGLGDTIYRVKYHVNFLWLFDISWCVWFETALEFKTRDATQKFIDEQIYNKLEAKRFKIRY